MVFEAFEVEEIEIFEKEKREKVASFLKAHHLAFEEDVDYSIAIMVDDVMIATGSCAKNIMKCIAVNEAYQGDGIAEHIVSRLMNKMFLLGEDHVFLVTKVANERIFEGLGFGMIARGDMPFVLMEYPKGNVGKYISSLGSPKYDGQIGAIVMNCNPFTKGHQYLIEYAAGQCDLLHVFIVSEERSVFPSQIRYQLVVEGVKHLNNVVLHYSGKYIISQATFPSYFLKEKSEASRVHAEIDMDFFARYIVPQLGINKRFVGREPYCKTTLLYNQVMRERLYKEQIAFEEVERIKINDEYVSASLVRQLIALEKMEEVKELVPESTYRFLISDESKNIISQIKERNKRNK